MWYTHSSFFGSICVEMIYLNYFVHMKTWRIRKNATRALLFVNLLLLAWLSALVDFVTLISGFFQHYWSSAMLTQILPYPGYFIEHRSGSLHRPSGWPRPYWIKFVPDAIVFSSMSWLSALVVGWPWWYRFILTLANLLNMCGLPASICRSLLCCLFQLNWLSV